MEIIRGVLQSYNILPLAIEKVSNRLYKIRDAQKEYALKKTNYDPSGVNNFIQAYSNKDLLKYMLPLYITKKNHLFVPLGDSKYYLSPWISNPGKVSLLKAHKLLEEIHVISLDQKEIKMKGFLKQVSSFEKNLAEQRKQALATIELFEQSHYMSPIELQYCTHYHRLQESFYHLEQEVSRIKEQGEESLTWKVCFIHGQFTRDHILKARQDKFIINWEQAAYNYPIYDLISFYKSEAKNVSGAKEEIVPAFNDYIKKLKLEPYEVSLLIIYLLDLTNYFRLLFSNLATLQKSKQLEEEFRILELGLHLRKGYNHSK